MTYAGSGSASIMITGDNALTAAAIAEEAGLDGFLAQATPEDKLALIRREQRGGNLVAMTGDGTNDAPALAQADVGVAMNTGTQAAREAGNMVDLDSDPTKLIEIVEIGKQLLITRGSLTTFSIANDVAKYFAIIPAMFLGVLPALGQHERDGPRVAALGDPVGRDLQRHHHRAARSTRVARRQVRRAHRHGDPAAESPHLRRRRADRTLHRYQAHRHRRHSPRSEMMRRQLLPAIMAVVLFTALTVVYVSRRRSSTTPLFHHKAEGSFVKDAHGHVVGSRLIGQNFTKTKYFHPRPAADDYASGPDYSYGSNYGPTDPRLVATCLPVQKTDKSGAPVVDRRATPVYETNPDGSSCDPNTVAQRVKAYREENHLGKNTLVPVDAVTASGSGLDPDIYRRQREAPGAACCGGPRSAPPTGAVAHRGEHRRARAGDPGRARSERARR